MTDRTHPDSGRATGGIVEMLQARIAELEAQLEAIGAGGFSPLIGQPQAIPDLSHLTERGAKAWAGVDAQGLREGFTAADMATAAAQGLRDGVASATREMPSWDEVFDCAVAAYCRSSTSHDALRLCFQSRSQQHQIACGWTANDLMGFARGIAALYTPPTSAEGVEHG